MPDVIVVGGGAAGIMAAWRAATLGAKVTLLEKTARLGTKILISGGGKCNITHDGEVADVLKPFRANERNFLRPSMYRFTNRQVVQMLTDRGLRVYTRPDGRIFPVDQTAKDVVAILASILENAGVDIRLNAPVEEILLGETIAGVKVGPPLGAHRGHRREGSAYGAKALLNEVLSSSGETVAPGTAPREILAKQVIVSVGGSSYPNSGTTGDGWDWARSLGHTVTKIRSALAPIYLQSPEAELAGVALRDCCLKARASGKEVARWNGDLLFTHQGVSGPCALGVSREVAESLEGASVSLEVDLMPGNPFASISEQLIAECSKHPLREVAKYLESLLPARIVPRVLDSADVDQRILGSKFDKRSRNRLVSELKGWRIGEVRAVPLEKGEVVAGGVTLEEVDPHTMESMRLKGLFFCGEVLDIAGPVGGYNLQAAFSTGFVAGESAARAALNR